MAPCLYHYDTARNKVPHYGSTGLNAGIMHMDLNRMRDIPDGWTRANMAMHDKFKSKIKLADQDILNILFHYYPEMLYELPCEWNYRVWQCSQVNISLYKLFIKTDFSITLGHAILGQNLEQ